MSRPRVASGDFASASEVVRAGLRALRDGRAETQERLEILRREVKIGVDQMRAGLFIRQDSRSNSR